MADEMLTISKNYLIDILTKGDIFHKDGIDIVLSRDGLSGVLKGVMCHTESLKQKSEHYKDRCQQLKEEVESLNHLLDKYEDQNKSEVDRWMNM